MRKLVSLIAFCFVTTVSLAQDIHFSQFYASPMTLNPSLTGKISSKYRMTGIYRSQWGSVSVPFITFSGSFDLPFLQKQLKKNFLGAGLVVLNDKSGTGALTNQSVYVSLAYHQKMDRRYNPHHYLSFGIRGGVVQKSVDINKLVFASSWDPISKQFGPISLEKFSTSGTFTYADFDAGLSWSSYFSDMFSVWGGITMHHLTQPKESFLLLYNSNTVINRRYTLNAGARIGVNERISINPTVLYLSQTAASEFNLGSTVSFNLTDEKQNPAAFYVGLFYRLGDAAVAMTAFEVHNTRIGLSYDFNLSNLRLASAARGGFELSLVHEGNPETAQRKVIYCPRF